MSERLTIQIRPQDNVAVAVRDLRAGTVTESGVVTLQDVPQAHKIALKDIPQGGAVICGNHVRNSDPFYIVYSFQRKDKIWVMAKE